MNLTALLITFAIGVGFGGLGVLLLVIKERIAVERRAGRIPS